MIEYGSKKVEPLPMNLIAEIKQTQTNCWDAFVGVYSLIAKLGKMYNDEYVFSFISKPHFLNVSEKIVCGINYIGTRNAWAI
jgi:hypothetical protein